MKHQSPSLFNDYQAVAEDKLLEYFRQQGVFSPPEDRINIPSKMIYARGQSQNVRIDRLIHASVQFCLENGVDPRTLVLQLLEEAQDKARWMH